jgi:hypothetical protein
MARKKRTKKTRRTTTRIARGRGTIFEKLFLLDLKKDVAIIVLWVFSVFAHNAISALFYYEEAVFLTLAVIAIPIYVLVAIIYTFIFHRKR